MIVNTGFPFSSFVTSLHNLGLQNPLQTYLVCNTHCKLILYLHQKHITSLHIVQLFHTQSNVCVHIKVRIERLQLVDN